VERCVLAAAAPADGPPRAPVRLALSHVVNERAFWSRSGFSWLDEPLREEGEKYLSPPT
jgi:hypothetical protein